MAERTPDSFRPSQPVSSTLEAVQSRRIRDLSEALEGDPSALAAFWTQVEAEGTPLIEPDGAPGYSIVTFVWRDPGEAHEVLVGANRVTDVDSFEHRRMQRLAGTDLWHYSFRMRSDWRATYQICPITQSPVPAGASSRERFAAFSRAGIADPFNTRQTVSRWTGAAGLAPCSIVELPDAPPQPWLTKRLEVPAGTITVESHRSELLGIERPVSVYLPPGYDPANGPYDLVLMVERDLEATMGTMLDNLIAQNGMRPMIALSVDSIDTPTRMRELSCNKDYVRFLTSELLPWATERWSITTDPARTVICGRSLGGLCAAFAGWLAPERFGNVLSQSGSFWWKRGSEFDVESEWLTRRFVLTERLPLRFYIEVGLQEGMLLPQNRHLRDVLDARGYDLMYREYNGGHDLACWQGSVAEGILHLLGTAPA